MSLFTISLIVAALTAQCVVAHPEFQERIPNAYNVQGVEAIGHVPKGHGSRNAFGKAFAAAGHKWTKALCQADSDGDGQTNGQELGDPCCEWVQKTNAKVLWIAGVSAPGDASSKSDPTLWANMTCVMTAAPSTAQDPATSGAVGVSVGSTSAVAIRSPGSGQCARGRVLVQERSGP